MRKLSVAVAIVAAIATVAIIACGIMLIPAQKTPPADRLPDNAPAAPLKFDEDGNFRILHLSDFHEWMGIERSSIRVDKQDTLKPLVAAYIDEVLDEYKPDLVVLGGDNTFSLSLLFDYGDEGVSTLTYRTIAETMERHNQYWTCTFGNHDSESYCSKAYFISLLIEYPHFIGGTSDGEYYKAATFSLSGKVNGCVPDSFIGNYSIPIFDGNKTAYNIYVLDSGSYTSPPPSGTPYLSITDMQTEWYASIADELTEANGAPVPSLLFTHIPFIEVGEAFSQGGLKAGYYAGISPSDKRSPILDECLKRGDMQAVFFGHNHENSATLIYEKNGKEIMFGVTPSCQAGSYSDTESVLSGRVIDLKSNGTFTTYIVNNKHDTPVKVAFPA